MAYSRWSHSRWYIYSPMGFPDGTIEICTDGICTVDQISLDLEGTVDRITKNKATKYDRKELYLYLKYIKEFHANEISYEQFDKNINLLRYLGSMRYYFKYKYLPSEWQFDGIPAKEKVYINKNRKNYKKTKKEEYYIGLYENSYVTIKFIDNKTFEYFDKKLNKITVKMNKRRHKILFPNYPIEIGVEYKYCTEGCRIVNSPKKRTEEWKELCRNEIRKRILELESELEKIK